MKVYSKKLTELATNIFGNIVESVSCDVEVEYGETVDECKSRINSQTEKNSIDCSQCNE